MSTTIGRKQLKTAITNQKEILREKCFSRIKNKRKHILEQLRNVQNQCALSEEERDQLDREFLEQQLKDILDECQNECEDELNTIDYYELLAEMQMEIDEYYKQEETDVLEERDQYSDELDEYEENLRFEQLMLNSDLPPPDFEETDDNCLVICPVCKRNELLHTPHSLFCQCGLRIVTEFDGVPITFVKQQIVNEYMAHRLVCKHEPIFSKDDSLGSSFLLMKCSHCCAFKVIV